LVSIHNPRIKYVRRLANSRFREREKKFLVEGIRFVEEALDSGWPVEMLIYTGKSVENPRAKKTAHNRCRQKCLIAGGG